MRWLLPSYWSVWIRWLNTIETLHIFLVSWYQSTIWWFQKTDPKQTKTNDFTQRSCLLLFLQRQIDWFILICFIQPNISWKRTFKWRNNENTIWKCWEISSDVRLLIFFCFTHDIIFIHQMGDWQSWSAPTVFSHLDCLIK